MKQSVIRTFPLCRGRRLTQTMGLAVIAALGLGWLTGCAFMQMESAEMRPETVFGVTAANHLVSFNAGTPGRLSQQAAISNLRDGENVLGIDFRPADGKLYALGSTGRLYTIDVKTAAATQVGAANFALPLNGSVFGFDFNPAADRIRVVSNTGQNLRLHPETGAVVDADAKMDGVQPDGQLAYAAADKNSSQKATIVAAAYTNSLAGAKITSNFGIDSSLGLLVTQGTREGVSPAVSPNTGQLFTVGSLGVPTSGEVAFDIAPKGGTAFAAITPNGASSSRFYWIDLTTGKANSIGMLDTGQAVRGIAVAPW